MTQHTPVCSWIRHHVIHVLTSHQYASGSWCERLCACELSRCVICECTHQRHQSIIDLFDNWNLPIYINYWLWAIWGVMNDELMMSCIITWFLSMRLVSWKGNQSTTSITLLITRDWGWCNPVSCLWWMPGCYRMYGDSSFVVIGESSFKVGLYFIYYDLQTLCTSKRI